MWSARFCTCLLLVVAVTACKSRESKPPAGSSASSSADAVQPTTTAETPTGADARHVAVTDAPEPAIDVVALSRNPVSRRAHRAARDAHRAANARHRSGQYKEAIAGYIGALAHNPGHLFARYNLASALASAGQRANALRILSAFDIADCSFCRSRLIRARADEEWQPLWQDPRFVALTADVTLDAAPVRTIVEGFMKALDSGDMATIARFVHPNQPIQITHETLVMIHNDEPGSNDHISRKQVLGVQALQSWIRSSGFAEPIRDEDSPIDQGAWLLGTIDSCDESCCKIEADCGDGCDVGHDGFVTSLDQVCIARDSGSAQYLSFIELTSVN